MGWIGQMQGACLHQGAQRAVLRIVRRVPLRKIPSLISWNPDIIRQMTVLRDEYINVLSRNSIEAGR